MPVVNMLAYLAAIVAVDCVNFDLVLPQCNVHQHANWTGRPV